MLFRNRKLDRVFDFIRESDWDIFCLQEVPEGFLKQLQTLSCSIAFRTDVDRLFFSGGTVHNYVVILSKHPIEMQGEIPFPEYWLSLPLHTRLFVTCMRPFGFSKVRNRGGIFADIRVPNASIVMRVFNLHLILAQPMLRMKEFEAAMVAHDPSRPTIVCGDFNILESPHITPLNFLMGGRVTDAFLYSRERTQIERRFFEYQLTNPHRGTNTHPLSQSQLDHILVSTSLSIKNAEVVYDRIGSDHHPIRVELT